MATLLQDLRFGLRALARARGFTAVAVAILALGIGANTTVFSLANAFFLKPLPVADPATMVRVYSNRFSNTSYRTYAELRDRNSTLADLAAFQLRSFGLRVDADNEHTFGEIVSGNYFRTIGIAAGHGRLLVPSDDAPGAPPVAVLAHTFWMRRLGGSPDVVGRTIALNGQPFTIVGIAPEGFTGVLAPLAGSLWVPMASDSVLRPGSDLAARGSFHMAGRLRPGVDRGRAQVDLDTIARQVRTANGETVREAAATVYGATMLHPEISLPVTVFTTVLLAVVALMLLIVCVNVANLVLARAAGRDREFAVRQALGAGRGRLVRQLLTENLILSVGGASVGLALAYWCTRLAMAAPLPAPVPIALDLSLDPRVVAYTAAIAILATLAFGLAPALTASRADLVRALKGAGDTPRHGRLRSAFLIGQVAMSVLLLVVAGLAIRSVRNAEHLDIGFDAAGVMTGSVDLETRGYSAERANQFLRSLVERLESAPGIAAASALETVPLTLSNSTTRLLRDGDQRPAEGQVAAMPLIYVNAVGPGHFKTLKIPLLSGRDFTYADAAGSPNAAIVNETMARQFWPGQDPVGQRLRPLDPDAAPADALVVVGVVRDSKYVTIGEEPRTFMYRPLAQTSNLRVSLLVRSAGGPGADVIATIKREIRGLDGGLAFFGVSSMDEAIAISVLPARIAGGLLGVLGLLALVLAALGVYGVLSFLVRARTREIGVRVAMGATPQTIAVLIVRQAMVWTLSGMAAGAGLALAVSRLLGSLLYGISPTDPLTFGAVILLLGTVAAVAAVVPALRASRLDPLVALRTL